MGIFDEDPEKIVHTHQLGQDLSLLSVDELQTRIAQLKNEVARLEKELSTKDESKNAAEAFFKRQ